LLGRFATKQGPCGSNLPTRSTIDRCIMGLRWEKE
jgi:hypothetical protein